MKNNSLSPYARVLVNSAYYAIYEKYPPKNRDVTDLAISVISGTIGYTDKKVVSSWIKKNGIDRVDGRGLSKNNFIALMCEWAGTIPNFATAEDIRHFAKYGRDVYVKWVYSQKFIDFCAKKKLPDGPLSPYWKSIRLSRPVIWHSLNLESTLLEDLENQPEEVVEELTNWIKRSPAGVRVQMANVFWLLSFSREAIDMAMSIVERKKWTWNELLCKLEKQFFLIKITDEDKGVRTLMRLIYDEFSPNKQELFALVGAFPPLRYYESLCFEALWQLPQKTAVKDELVTLEEWSLLQALGKERWKISESVFKVTKRWFTDISVPKQKVAKEWKKRYLKSPQVTKVFRQTMHVRRMPIQKVLDYGKFKEMRKKYRISRYKQDNFWKRLFREGICLLKGKVCDSDASFFDENSRQLDSEQYLYAYFLLDQWKGIISQAVFEAVISVILLAFFSKWSGWFLPSILVGLVIIFRAVLRIMRVEWAWLDFWKTYLKENSGEDDF